MSIYKTFLPIRIILVLNLIGGIGVGFVAAYSYLNDIKLGVLLFAFPLLSIAMILNAFSTSRIRFIHFNSINSTIEILKESLFEAKTVHLNSSDLKVELLSPNKNKFFSIPELILKIYENDVLKEEINSSFLSLNNQKIGKAYNALKKISHANLII